MLLFVTLMSDTATKSEGPFFIFPSRTQHHSGPPTEMLRITALHPRKNKRQQQLSLICSNINCTETAAVSLEAQHHYPASAKKLARIPKAIALVAYGWLLGFLWFRAFGWLVCCILCFRGSLGFFFLFCFLWFGFAFGVFFFWLWN